MVNTHVDTYADFEISFVSITLEDVLAYFFRYNL